MRRSRLVLATLGLLMANAVAQPKPQPSGPDLAPGPDLAWTSFSDPTENAFTVDAPQGWRVAGGVRRFAPSEAKPWVTAVSPDGLTELFLGDPSVPMFALPNPAMGMQEGSQTPGLHRPGTVMRYRPGAEFAAMYGTRSLSSVCANVQMQGTQPLPQLVDEIRGKMLVPAQGNTRLDAGLASFTCESNGQPFSAAVAAATYLFDPTGVGGNWQTVALFGFRTPRGHEAETSQVLAHMRQSFKLNPQWEAAINQAGQQESQEIQRRNAAAAQPQAPGAGLATVTPGAPPQRDITTPFLLQQAQKEDQHQEFMCHIRNGGVLVRYWDPQFGRYRPRCQ